MLRVGGVAQGMNGPAEGCRMARVVLELVEAPSRQLVQCAELDAMHRPMLPLLLAASMLVELGVGLHAGVVVGVNGWETAGPASEGQPGSGALGYDTTELA